MDSTYETIHAGIAQYEKDKEKEREAAHKKFRAPDYKSIPIVYVPGWPTDVIARYRNHANAAVNITYREYDGARVVCTGCGWNETAWADDIRMDDSPQVEAEKVTDSVVRLRKLAQGHADYCRGEAPPNLNA